MCAARHPAAACRGINGGTEPTVLLKLLNMKSIIIIICSTLVLAAWACPSEESIKFRDSMGEVIKKCSEEHKISRAEAQKALFSKSVPESQEGKCGMTCVLTEIGVISEDGSPKTDACKGILGELFKGDDDGKKKAEDTVDKCAGEVKASDKCEKAAEFMSCYSKNGPQSKYSEKVNKMIDLMKDCSDKHTIEDDEAEQISKGNLPTSTNGKCYAACFLQGTGGMDKDGKLDAAKLKEGYESAAEKKDKLDEMKSAIDKCVGEATESDQCEAAGTYMKCMKDNAPKCE